MKCLLLTVLLCHKIHKLFIVLWECPILRDVHSKAVCTCTKLKKCFTIDALLFTGTVDVLLRVLGMFQIWAVWFSPWVSEDALGSPHYPHWQNRWRTKQVWVSLCTRPVLTLQRIIVCDRIKYCTPVVHLMMLFAAVSEHLVLLARIIIVHGHI